MNSLDSGIYEFGPFRIDAQKRQLLRGDEPVALTPKVFDTLLYLVQHKGKIVEKDELMQAIWPDTAVEQNNLNQNISTLRRLLGESRNENRYIMTVPGKGYRFLAGVEMVSAASAEVSFGATLAVLPFENLSSDPEREYLADGLTEETIATVGQIDPEHLRVIGRTSVMAYKRTTKTLAEIGRELDAGYLIESSIRAEGGRLRITSKLIRARDQVQMWSSSYDSEPGSLLSFQRELSAAIAEQIRLRLSPERLTALERRQTSNAEAYDLYLRGRHFWHQLSPATTKRAVEYFARATEIDQRYALAWCGLADTYGASPINGDAPPLTVWSRARDAVAHAVEAEPNLAEVQASLGFLNFWLNWDWKVAETAFRRAIELDPGYPLPHRMMGILCAHMGRHDEAGPAICRARELEPLLPVHQALSAQVAFLGRDFEAAVQFAKQAIVVDPGFWIGYLQLGQAYEQLGENTLALEALSQAGRFGSANSKVIALRGYLYAKLGRNQEAEEVLKTLKSVVHERYVPPYAMALVHAGLFQQDAALEWLERGYNEHDVHLIFLPADPKWDSFRANVGFLALLRRCSFAAPPYLTS